MIASTGAGDGNRTPTAQPSPTPLLTKISLSWHQRLLKICAQSGLYKHPFYIGNALTHYLVTIKIDAFDRRVDSLKKKELSR